MAIPDKLDYVQETKVLISNKIASTGQNIQGVPFRNYANLIENIPNTGAISKQQINDLTELVINISGEKA